MSIFQISLAIIGLLVLALVVAYNFWIAQCKAREKNRPARTPAWSEALRQEPALDGKGGALQGHAVISEGAPAVPTTRLDAHIDAIAPVQVPRMVDGATALKACPAAQRAGQKPFAIEGMNAETRQWEPLHEAQRYTAFQAGVQLVNRSGALTELEFSEFAAQVQQFSDALSALVQLPDMAEAVERARILDQFASERDMQICLVLRPSQGAWSASYVRQSAQQLGFDASEPYSAHLHLPQTTQAGSDAADAADAVAAADALQTPPANADTAAPAPLLCLSLHCVGAAQAMAIGEAPELGDDAVVGELHLALDVPQVPARAQPFEALRAMAHKLCHSLDATLCDQNGQLLSEQYWEPERERLQELYRQLQEQDLAAGSTRALRIFA